MTDLDAAADTMAERIHPYLDEKAAPLLDVYYDPQDKRYAGSDFETIGEKGRDEITADDLVAINLLAVRAPTEAIRWILGSEGAKVCRERLVDIPMHDIWVSDEEKDLGEGSPASRLWHRLRKFSGIGPAIAGKLLARKRPALIPVYDSVISNALGFGSFDYWKALHRVLKNQDIQRSLQSAREQASAVSPDLPLLRVLDVAIWMRDSDSAAPDRKELGIKAIRGSDEE